jgi:hypothetical protein
MIFIPFFGFLASSWVTLFVYLFLAVANYWWGQKYYPVPYNLGKLGVIIGLSIFIYGLASFINPVMGLSIWVLNPLWLAIFGCLIYIVEKKFKTGYAG